MSDKTEQPTGKELAIKKVTSLLDQDIVKSRFNEVLGDRNSGPYIASVIITVKDSPALLACSPGSIYSSALRAAALRLSVDPSTGQAYMIPYGGQAVLVVGYKGLYDMAVRTGKYRYINVGPIYEGMIVDENPISGFHTISGTVTDKTKIIGWIGAFEMNPERGQATGFGKTLYMTVEEIHAHAKQYSPGYNNKNGVWAKEVHKMERKTVLRILLRRWGYLDPADAAHLSEAEDSQAIEGQATDIYDIPIPDFDENADQTHAETRSKEELLHELTGN